MRYSVRVISGEWRTPVTKSSIHYPLFDYLRILLAVGVFVEHSRVAPALPSYFGDACVQVFFALSGFLIGSILLNTDVGELPRFYFKRVVRIWVPYGLAVAALMALCLLLQDLDDPLLWQTAFYNVTFVVNLFDLPRELQFHAPMWGACGHFWSICVEEQFYLLAPLVVVLLPRWRVSLLVAIALLNLLVPHSFAAISLGVLLARATSRRALRGGEQLLFAGIFLVTAVVIFREWVRYETAVPVLAASLVSALSLRGVPSRLGAVLGGMSYPFYLNHWIVLFLRKRVHESLGMNFMAATGAALALALALAAAHYLVVDRTILAARDRWYTALRGKLAWATGLALVAVGVAGGFYFKAWNHAHELPARAAVRR